jgi:hypothetical protein
VGTADQTFYAAPSASAAGALKITDSPACSAYDGGTGATTGCSAGAVLAGTNLSPGDELHGSVTITNSGAAASYTVTGASPKTSLAQALALTLAEQRPGDAGLCALTWQPASGSIAANSHCLVIYSGTAAGFGGFSAGIASSAGGKAPWLPQESHQFQALEGLPQSAGNALQGATVVSTITFTAAHA